VFSVYYYFFLGLLFMKTILLNFAGYCSIMGYPIKCGYFIQQVAEMAWPQAGFEGGFLTEAVASINSEFTGEEDKQILEMAGNVHEWWLQPDDPLFVIGRETVDRMYAYYIEAVGPCLIYHPKFTYSGQVKAKGIKLQWDDYVHPFPADEKDFMKSSISDLPSRDNKHPDIPGAKITPEDKIKIKLLISRAMKNVDYAFNFISRHEERLEEAIDRSQFNIGAYQALLAMKMEGGKPFEGGRLAEGFQGIYPSVGTRRDRQGEDLDKSEDTGDVSDEESEEDKSVPTRHWAFTKAEKGKQRQVEALGESEEDLDKSEDMGDVLDEESEEDKSVPTRHRAFTKAEKGKQRQVEALGESEEDQNDSEKEWEEEGPNNDSANDNDSADDDDSADNDGTSGTSVASELLDSDGDDDEGDF
jgi:hypothetical protein